MSNTESKGWVGVDLDGTLAHYDGWNGGEIGEPIPAMVNKVKNLIATGVKVKIFTARVAGHGLPAIGEGVTDVITPIQDWCEKHIGHRLEVTNVKDFQMIRLYDDRCVQIESNTGSEIGGSENLVDALKEFQLSVFETAKSKGWYEMNKDGSVVQRNMGELIALMHSELSEALEADRHGNPPDDKIPQFSGVEAELADVMIRIFDTAEARGLKVIEAMIAKAEMNKSRAIKHGGKAY